MAIVEGERGAARAEARRKEAARVRTEVSSTGSSQSTKKARRYEVMQLYLFFTQVLQQGGIQQLGNEVTKESSDQRSRSKGKQRFKE